MNIIFIFFKITLRKIIMLIFINKNNIYLLQNNTNQSFCNAFIYMYKQYILQRNTKLKILAFKSTRLILT